MIKFKAALMYFLSGVIVAVAVVVAYSSLVSGGGNVQ